MREIEAKIETITVTLAPEAALLMIIGLSGFLILLILYSLTIVPPSCQ